MKQNILNEIGEVLITGILARTAYSIYTKHDGTLKLDYKVLEKNKNYELRKYDSYIIAQVTIPAVGDVTGKAFRILGGYIFGKNKSSKTISMTTPVIIKSEKIAMTSPVLTQKNDEFYTMSFIMPSEYTIDNLPMPNDDKIKFIQIKPHKAAIYSFSRYANNSRIQKLTQKLKNDLDDDNIEYLDDAIVMRYDQPFIVPFLMKNEIALKIK